MPIECNQNVPPRVFEPPELCPNSRTFVPKYQRLHIGLVNSMPDGALEATARQFVSLLRSSASTFLVKVSLYALPEVPRARSGAEHIRRFYNSVTDLWGSRLDGLILTGTEPVAHDLTDEPYWPSLKKVVEWAEYNSVSTVWSCLAAHAAVLHLDGVTRHPLVGKRFGIFECARASDHELNAGAFSSFDMPHSRWNDLNEAELVQAGYRVLSRASDGGVDTFTKAKNSQFLFFQGHPEYEAVTLLLEYRRDLRRFFLGKRDRYPALPLRYFDQETAGTLATLAEQAVRHPSEELLTRITNVLETARIVDSWRPIASRIYTNWLMSIAAMKGRRQRQSVVVGLDDNRVVDQAS